MRSRFAILLAIAGLFMTALSADVSTALPSENVRAHSAKVAVDLSALMASTVRPIPVIVLLNASATTGAVSRLQELSGAFPVRYVYKVIPGFAADLTSGQIAALARDATVHRIEFDAEVRAHSPAGMSYGTDTARTDFLVDGDMDGNPTNYTKDDVVITILDTGIDTLHMDLDGGKVIAWKDFVNDSVAPYDDRGHGTACASIAAGTGDGSKNKVYQGVAPGAALVGVKVLDSNGSSPSSRVVAGIDWVVANRAAYNIRVLSISLGSSGNSDGKDALSKACNNAVDAGLVVCVSAGNDGPQTNTIGSPAAAAKPITVGAMSAYHSLGGWFLCDFSSRGPTKDKRVKPDICGPGYCIAAAAAGTTDGYCVFSGTSMAAPFVAGAAALMLDAKPDLTPAVIKSDLISTAMDWGPPSADIDYGSGRLLGYDAVRLAYYQAGHDTAGYTSPFDLPHVYRADKLGGKGKTDIWQVNCDTTGMHGWYHGGLTMIMPNWKSGSSPNFDVYLYDPTGTLVDSATTQLRQDYFYHRGMRLGNWQIRVTSKAGSGNYFFDLSCPNATSITQIQNQFGPGPQGEPAPLAGSGVPLLTEPAEFRNGDLRLGFELAQPGQVRMAVYDGAGRVVAASAVNARSGRNEMTVGLPQASGGVYFYRLEAGTASAFGKFAVIR